MVTDNAIGTETNIDQDKFVSLNSSMGSEAFIYGRSNNSPGIKEPSLSFGGDSPDIKRYHRNRHNMDTDDLNRDLYVFGSQ